MTSGTSHIREDELPLETPEILSCPGCRQINPTTLNHCAYCGAHLMSATASDRKPALYVGLALLGALGLCFVILVGNVAPPRAQSPWIGWQSPRGTNPVLLSVAPPPAPEVLNAWLPAPDALALTVIDNADRTMVFRRESHGRPQTNYYVSPSRGFSLPPTPLVFLASVDHASTLGCPPTAFESQLGALVGVSARFVAHEQHLIETAVPASGQITAVQVLDDCSDGRGGVTYVLRGDGNTGQQRLTTVNIVDAFADGSFGDNPVLTWSYLPSHPV